jgi:hypothetical protein
MLCMEYDSTPYQKFACRGSDIGPTAQPQPTLPNTHRKVLVVLPLYNDLMAVLFSISPADCSVLFTLLAVSGEITVVFGREVG